MNSNNGPNNSPQGYYGTGNNGYRSQAPTVPYGTRNNGPRNTGSFGTGTVRVVSVEGNPAEVAEYMSALQANAPKNHRAIEAPNQGPPQSPQNRPYQGHPQGPQNRPYQGPSQGPPQGAYQGYPSGPSQGPPQKTSFIVDLVQRFPVELVANLPTSLFLTDRAGWMKAWDKMFKQNGYKDAANDSTVKECIAFPLCFFATLLRNHKAQNVTDPDIANAALLVLEDAPTSSIRLITLALFIVSHMKVPSVDYNQTRIFMVQAIKQISETAPDGVMSDADWQFLMNACKASLDVFDKNITKKNNPPQQNPQNLSAPVFSFSAAATKGSVFQ
jgi:hypothetical protein